VKVLLEGQGADEMMAGYHGYPDSRIRSLIEQKNFAGAIALIIKWSRWPGRDWKALSAQGLAAALPALAQNQTLRRGAINLLNLGANQAAGFVKKEFLNAPNQRPLIPSQEHHGRRLIEALGVALGEKGVTALLRHSDRNSMHFSVESRVPFLTTSFASLMLSLPEAYLLSDSGETKSVFRSAMRGIVPDEILDRRDKIGFETKDQSWLRQILTSGRDFLAPIEQLEFIDTYQVRESLESAQRIGGSLGWSNWRAINFSVWYELNFP
jgi:asparagine synthase (glutamine-hydrolysing)